MIVFGEKLFINPLKKIVAFNFDELKAAFAELEELKKTSILSDTCATTLFLNKVQIFRFCILKYLTPTIYIKLKKQKNCY